MTTSRPRGTSESKSTNRWVVYAAFGALSCVSAYYFGRASTSRVEAEGAESKGTETEGAALGREATADGERLAQLEREVKRLRAMEVQVARLRAQQGVPQQMTAGATELEPPAAVAPLSPEEQEAKAREEEAAYHTELDARLAAEPVDPNWRRETEAAIAQIIPAQMGPGVRVGDVECASTICKVVLSHTDSPRIAGDKFAMFVTNRGSLGAFELQADNSRESTTTLYLLHHPEALHAAKDSVE